MRYKSLLKRREQINARLGMLNQVIEKSKSEFLLSRQSGKTSHIGFNLAVDFEIIYLEMEMIKTNIQIKQHRISKIRTNRRRRLK